MNVIISGASSGIGRYLANRLERQGHYVWGLARSPLARAGRFRSLICNVAEWEQVLQAAEIIKAEPGWTQIHAVIHCAAQQGPIGSTVQIDPAAWSNTIRTNLDGTFHVVRAFHGLLAGQEGLHAKVLCFSGGGATKARPNFSAYAASKTAVVRLVENLAEEWKGLPIDINAIAPGALSTKMTEQVLALDPKAVGGAEVETARRAQAQGDAGFERLGRLVNFLLSSKSDGITGKLVSAPWDPWETFPQQIERLRKSDLLTLRRITPEELGEEW